MNKLLLIARREYLFNLRRPAFLFAVFGVPVFTFFMWFVIFAVVGNSETDVDRLGTIGYVDLAGVLTNPVVPEDVTLPLQAYPDDASARAALDAKTIGAYFLLPEDYLQTGVVQTYSYDGIPEVFEDQVEALMLANLSREVQSDVPLERIQDPVEMTIRAEDSGRIITEANIPILIFLPMIFALVFMMSSGVTSGFLMNGVVEEKTNRIVEILITSVTPLQLLVGKILGLGLLGLTQLVVWGVAGFVLFSVGQSTPVLNGLSFPADLMALFVIYFILSYFLLASLLAGIGAVTDSEQESRQVSSIISLLFVIPFFFIVTFIEDPNGPLPVALTLIPVTAPMTALLRAGFGAIPAWQLILSLLILLVTTIVVVWASAKIFRWGLLLYGKRIGPRELWRVIRQSPPAATVATQEQTS